MTINTDRLHPPRFMTDEELREHFGLSERALRRCRGMHEFPRREPLIGKTDSKAVDRYFDRLAGLDANESGRVEAVEINSLGY